jgi:hypothetical protein
MTALPPEERPPGRPGPTDPAARTASNRSGASAGHPPDEVLELLASVVVVQASLEGLEVCRPSRGHPLQTRRWRREREVLLLQRQMLKLRVESLPTRAFAPFPRPCV